MNNFNKIKDPGLKAWNRLVNYLNLLSAHKTKEEAKDYLRQFTKEDNDQIRNVLKQIEERGHVEARRTIIEGAGL